MIYLNIMNKIIIISMIVAISNLNFANNLALPCYGCHVKNDKSYNSSIPSIEGLDEKYIVNAMEEYKNKLRDNYLMQIISNGYSKEQIKSLANFFSKQKNKYD